MQAELVHNHHDGQSGMRQAAELGDGGAMERECLRISVVSDGGGLCLNPLLGWKLVLGCE